MNRNRDALDVSPKRRHYERKCRVASTDDLSVSLAHLIIFSAPPFPVGQCDAKRDENVKNGTKTNVVCTRRTIIALGPSSRQLAALGRFARGVFGGGLRARAEGFGTIIIHARDARSSSTTAEPHRSRG